MERFRDQLFAGAAFAEEEDGRTAGRDLGDEVEDAQHGLAFADDVFKVVALLEGALKLDILFLGAIAGDRGANVGEELFVVPGLLDEVLRSGADSVDDIVYRPESGDHDDRQVGVALADLAEDFNAVEAGQSEIEENEVIGALADGVEPGLAVVGGVDGVAFEVQQGLEGFANAGFIVDDQDPVGFFGVRGGRLGRQSQGCFRHLRVSLLEEILGRRWSQRRSGFELRSCRRVPG